jgi:hypothetical protein
VVVEGGLVFQAITKAMVMAVAVQEDILLVKVVLVRQVSLFYGFNIHKQNNNIKHYLKN